jgi:hypothetical protein
MRRSAWAALLLSAAVVAAALVEPRAFRAAFVHAHNLLALAIWVVLFRRGKRLALSLVPVIVVLIGAGLLGSGALLGGRAVAVPGSAPAAAREPEPARVAA